MEHVNKNMKKIIYTSLLLVIFLVVSTFSILIYKNSLQSKLDREIIIKNAFGAAILGNNPKPMQDLFLEKVRSGLKDEDANSFAYWVWHRYYDNGGNMYEIYNFVQKNPELSFLNEAEILEPIAFKEIKDKKSRFGSVNSFKAFLAYVTILDNYGYTNAPIVTTLAAKNITFAREEKEKKDYDKLIYENYVKKADTYAQRSEALINSIIDSNFTLLKNKQDMVVSVNQYIDTLTEYKILGMERKTKYSIDEIFSKIIVYSKNNVNILFFYTGYNRAVSLLRLEDKDNSKYEQALFDIAKYDYVNSPFKAPGNMLYKIVNSKEDTKYDVGYNYKVVVGLSEMYPEFRSWLIKSGWTEADFLKLENVKPVVK